MSDPYWPRMGAAGTPSVNVTLSADIAPKEPLADATQRIAELEAERDGFRDKWMASEAEMANVRARAKRDAGAASGSLQDAEDLFGLSGDYSPSELRARFAGLMRQVHPDVAGKNGLARRVTEARDAIKAAKGW